MIDQETISLLMKGVNNVTWQSLVMIGVSFVLFYLAIVKDYEPLLLLPIGAGCMLANLPLSPLIAEDGMLKILYEMGVGNEMFPLLVFIGIGALTDFGPLLENPKFVLLGAAGLVSIIDPLYYKSLAPRRWLFMAFHTLTLFAALLRALRPGTRLVMVGDADQLPSVGAGNVFSDMIRSGLSAWCNSRW